MLKRYNMKQLLNSPTFCRNLICKETVISMAREDVDINIDMVYDNYISKRLKLPDGYVWPH